MDALDAGCDVMIFSDNMPVEQEITLKDIAAELDEVVSEFSSNDEHHFDRLGVNSRPDLLLASIIAETRRVREEADKAQRAAREAYDRIRERSADMAREL